MAAARDALTARLAAAGVPTPAVDAELLLAHVLGWSRSDVRVRGREAVPAAAAEALERAAARRIAREPLQLIVGTVGFRHLTLAVRAGVFVPRPETEVLVEVALARTPRGARVVEPCTGTGAVACSIALEAGARVLATDVSEEAVALARENSEATGAGVDVRQGDLFAPVPEDWRQTVDVVICNPPYLATDELAGVEPELAHDPVAALVAGPTGWEVTDRLLDKAPVWLAPGGWLVLEAADTRAEATGARATACGWTEVSVEADLTGRPRVVAARRPTP